MWQEAMELIVIRKGDLLCYKKNQEAKIYVLHGVSFLIFKLNYLNILMRCSSG